MHPGRVALVAALSAGFCLADALSDALRAGRFDDALRLADELLQTQPRDVRIWTGRGAALAGLHRDSDSIASFERALQLAPGFAPALKAAVEAGYRSRDPRTVSLLDRLLRVEPANAIAHAMAGVLAFESGDCRRAVPHFESARAEMSANEQAATLYGGCLVAVNRPRDAIPLFRRLLDRHPGDVRARFNLGYAQLLGGQSRDAVGTLAPLAGSGDADSLNLLAAAEAASGGLESAVAHLQQAIRAAPKEERNYLDLAALSMQHESEDTAAAIVDAGLGQLPQSARLHAIRGILKAQAGAHDEAAAEFELANRLDPPGQLGAAGLGLLYTETQRPAMAASVLRERLRQAPRDATLNLLLAQALMQERLEPGSPRFAEAVRALELAIASQPAMARPHTLLGKLYVQAQDYARAVTELRLGARYDPSDRMAFSQLAIALRRLGRDREAAEAVAALKRIVISDAQPKAGYQRIQITPSPNRSDNRAPSP